jgi:DNA-binding PadR family transcriptional regulator
VSLLQRFLNWLLEADKEELILDLLGDEEKFGLDLVKESEGALKRGTIYVTLSRMEKRGVIVAREVTVIHELEDENRRWVNKRRLYRRGIPRAWVESGERGNPHDEKPSHKPS